MVKIKTINYDEKNLKLIVDFVEIPEKSIIIPLEGMNTISQLTQSIISQAEEIIDRRNLINELKLLINQQL